jgi:hypothetical protein
MEGRHMKESQQHSIITACLLPALLALSPAVFAKDTAARYDKQINVATSDPVFWSIPPISRQWGIPLSTSDILTPTK